MGGAASGICLQITSAGMTEPNETLAPKPENNSLPCSNS